MDFRDLLRSLQGTMTQQQFGELIGVSQSTLSRLYAGQFVPSRDLILALIKSFPARRQEILDVFFSPGYASTHDIMSIQGSRKASLACTEAQQ